MLSRPEESAIELDHLKFGELEILEAIWGHAAGTGACKEDSEQIDETIVAFLEQN